MKLRPLLRTIRNDWWLLPCLGLSLLHFCTTFVLTFLYGIKRMDLPLHPDHPRPVIDIIAELPLSIQILSSPIGFLAYFLRGFWFPIFTANSIIVGFSPIWLRVLYRILTPRRRTS